VSEIALNLHPKFVLSLSATALFSIAANGQSIEVPFNWKAGAASDYALEVTAKRPESPGEICTLNGRLKLEVLARSATTADIRTTPSTLNFKVPCRAPSLRQTLLMRLNGDLDKADMAHKTDAVTWWNETGRQYGAKAPEVRSWMLDSKNYYLELNSINRSQGSILGQTTRYLPPLK
jgi:HNH/ENDO VII superfamily nuclease with conserved GHE residues